jgi:hypothetical protein
LKAPVDIFNLEDATEDARVLFTDVESYFDELARLIEGKPAVFIFNLGESSFQAWADKRVQHVIVPACYQSDEIPITVDRTVQRNSLFVYIAADGPCLRPLFILPRKNSESELMKQGINSELATTPIKFRSSASSADLRSNCFHFIQATKHNRVTSVRLVQ